MNISEVVQKYYQCSMLEALFIVQQAIGDQRYQDALDEAVYGGPSGTPE